jgi:nicotinamidase-related amidase
MNGKARCWDDVFPPDVIDHYRRTEHERTIGPSPALLAIDLYEFVYQGGPRPVRELRDKYASSCGEYAYAAIEPTKRLFAAARAANIPIYYSTGDDRADARPDGISATNRRTGPPTSEKYAIRPEFKPQPGDVVITKQRASAFFGTPLTAHLTQQEARTVIICGESTSGCVRSTVIDAYSYGFRPVVVEECCFDRNLISHKVSLFDMHHKYADVFGLDDVEAHLRRLAMRNTE